MSIWSASDWMFCEQMTCVARAISRAASKDRTLACCCMPHVEAKHPPPISTVFGSAWLGRLSHLLKKIWSLSCQATMMLKKIWCVDLPVPSNKNSKGLWTEVPCLSSASSKPLTSKSAKPLCMPQRRKSSWCTPFGSWSTNFHANPRWDLR